MSWKFWKKEQKFDFDKLSSTLQSNTDPFAPDQLGLSQDRTAGLAGTTGLPPQQFSDPFANPDMGPDVIRGKQNYLREVPSNQSRPGQASEVLEKDMEIISSKLDAIKAMVENVNHRLDQIERQGKEPYKHW